MPFAKKNKPSSTDVDVNMQSAIETKGRPFTRLQKRLEAMKVKDALIGKDEKLPPKKKILKKKATKSPRIIDTKLPKKAKTILDPLLITRGDRPLTRLQLQKMRLAEDEKAARLVTNSDDKNMMTPPLPLPVVDVEKPHQISPHAESSTVVNTVILLPYQKQQVVKSTDEDVSRVLDKTFDASASKYDDSNSELSTITFEDIDAPQKKQHVSLNKSIDYSNQSADNSMYDLIGIDVNIPQDEKKYLFLEIFTEKMDDYRTLEKNKQLSSKEVNDIQNSNDYLRRVTIVEKKQSTSQTAFSSENERQSTPVSYTEDLVSSRDGTVVAVGKENDDVFSQGGASGVVLNQEHNIVDGTDSDVSRVLEETFDAYKYDYDDSNLGLSSTFKDKQVSYLLDGDEKEQFNSSDMSTTFIKELGDDDRLEIYVDEQLSFEESITSKDIEEKCGCNLCRLVFTLSEIKCSGKENASDTSLSQIKEMIKEELKATEKLRFVLNMALGRLSDA